MTRVGWSWGVLAFGLLAVGAGGAQSPKEMRDTGMTLADQCAGLKLVCRAATMDKKYQKDCDTFKVSINGSSNRDLASGYEKLDQQNFTRATQWAGAVCDYDPTLAAKKHELLDAIKKAQEPQVVKEVATPPPAPRDEVSPKKADEAEHDFESGDFEGAVAAARQVSDKSLQGRSTAVLQKIASYNNAIAEARQREPGDPQGALQVYRTALGISTRGPGDPAGHISVLEARLHPPPPPNNPAGGGTRGQPLSPKPVAVDPGVEAGRLVAEARLQEAHNLQQAMRTYENVLRVQPGNPEAVASLARVQGLINSDPKEQAKVLADGIRAFYSAQYAEAEDDLMSYVSSTSAKYRGAAHFYIGVIQLYRGILDSSGQKVKEAEKSGNVQRWFKDARNECYRPIDKYLSPVVLNAWNVSPVSTGCAR